MFHLLPLSYSVPYSPPRDKEIGELKTGHTDCLLFSQSELVMLGTKVATFRYSADELVAVGAMTVLRPPIHHRQRPLCRLPVCREGAIVRGSSAKAGGNTNLPNHTSIISGGTIYLSPLPEAPSAPRNQPATSEAPSTRTIRNIRIVAFPYPSPTRLTSRQGRQTYL